MRYKKLADVQCHLAD